MESSTSATCPVLGAFSPLTFRETRRGKAEQWERVKSILQPVVIASQCNDLGTTVAPLTPPRLRRILLRLFLAIRVRSDPRIIQR